MAVHFNTVHWAKNANVYEVNIRQYTPEGNFKAFAQHLPRLKDMGVDILWLMPITPISHLKRQGQLGSYYACKTYTNINPEFGTLQDFDELMKNAHALGMKVIIDWVANHTGCDHEWTYLHAEWYKKDASGNFMEENGWADVFDLDYTATAMRTAMIGAMQFWVKEHDIDGFRCDMAHLVPLDFWKEARIACDALKPLFWLAETETVPYHDVFDVSYAWRLMHTTEKQAKGDVGINEVYNVLHGYSQYPQGAQKLLFTANHDENSWNGTEYEKYGQAAKAWAVLTCTWQGTPLIYSGQELPNHKRLLFFDKDQIEWQQPVALHDFYKSLLALHKQPAISEGETFILPSPEGTMCWLRKKDAATVLILLNLSNQSRLQIPINHPWLQGTYSNLFTGVELPFMNEETFELQSYEYLVYVKQ
jgi:glycosidase